MNTFTSSHKISTGLMAFALLLNVNAVQAADLEAKKLPPQAAVPAASVPIDFAFGARVVSDYNFRGISQTNRRPAVQAYGELQLLDNFFYAGIAVYRVDLATRPNSEIDFTAGIRPKFGAFTFDLGLIQYYYPDERRLIDAANVIYTPKNTDYLEVAGKVAYAATDALTLGANVFYSWNWLGTRADATYGSLTAKYVLPETVFPAGLSVSGELGRYWIGTSSPILGGLNLPDYTYWSAGLSYNYKIATLDLRYHDTDLSKTKCFLLTSDPGGVATGSGRSKWCGATFVATLSFDITASQLGVFSQK